MITQSPEITADDCYCVQLSNSMLLDELRGLLEAETIPQGDAQQMREFYQRVDSLHDALYALKKKFARSGQ